MSTDVEATSEEVLVLVEGEVTLAVLEVAEMIGKFLPSLQLLLLELDELLKSNNWPAIKIKLVADDLKVRAIGVFLTSGLLTAMLPQEEQLFFADTAL